jgi:integrase
MVGLGRKNPHKMANLKVALWRYVRSTRRDWHRVHVEPVRSGRGFTEDWDKPKTFGPDCVALGPWGLKWYGDKGKAIYQRLDSDLQESLNARDRKEKDLKADAADINAGRSPREEDITRETLVKRKEKFIQKKLDKKLDKESISAYEHLIGEFLEVTQRRYPEDVTEDDMQDFCRALRNRNLSERTVMNYAGSVLTFLRSTKVLSLAKIDEIKEAIPKVEDPLPIAYSKQQYEQFMAAVTNERHKLYFQTLLMTGMREREASHLRWDNLDFEAGNIRIDPVQVTHMMVRGQEKEITFKSKNRKPRFVEVPEELLTQLREWRKKFPDTEFVFGTPKRNVSSTGDLPDGHLLDALKRYAFAAGLNCKKCPQCRKTGGKLCGTWKLHRFRHTFATTVLRSGVDPASVRDLLGHHDMSMTNKYIAANPDLKKKVGSAFEGWN